MKVFDENLTFSLRIQGYSFSTSKDVLVANIAREESVAVYGFMHSYVRCCFNTSGLDYVFSSFRASWFHTVLLTRKKWKTE